MWIFCSGHIALISLASTVLFRILPLKFSSTLFFLMKDIHGLFCGINAFAIISSHNIWQDSSKRNDDNQVRYEVTLFRLSFSLSGFEPCTFRKHFQFVGYPIFNLHMKLNSALRMKWSPREAFCLFDPT